VRSQIKSIQAHIELASLLQKISKVGESIEEKERKTELEKKITSKANARDLPDDFARQLEEKVEEFTKSDDAENFIGIIKFKEAICIVIRRKPTP
jgi:hypothetical protein